MYVNDIDINIHTSVAESCRYMQEIIFIFISSLSTEFNKFIFFSFLNPNKSESFRNEVPFESGIQSKGPDINTESILREMNIYYFERAFQGIVFKDGKFRISFSD